jgi:UDP-glucose 4-epimerase
MKILVTGGAGFIGSWLVDRFVEKGMEVTVIDNLKSGSKDNIHYIDDVEFIEGDIRDDELLAKHIKYKNAVVHLAAIVSVPYSIEYPQETFDVNSVGTLKLLRAAVEYGVEKFVYISTCAVYGEAQYLPIDEEHPLTPISPYANSKLLAEYTCIHYSRLYGINSVILRLFNVYGPGQGYSEYSGVITKFIHNVMGGKPPVIYGDGNQIRDFIYVDDVAEAIFKALDYWKEEYEIFNIGSGVGTRIKNLTKLVVELMNKPGLRPIHTSRREGDIFRSQADISKAKKELKFSPRILLKEGLMKTISSLG